MILWPAPPPEHNPARAEPLALQSIKQPQLDLHSRLHNLGTYRVKAPGRDPLWWPRRKEQAVAPLMADQPAGTGDPGRRSSVKARLTANRRRRPVENDEYARFVQRVMRAYTKRVAGRDVDALADMAALATELDEAMAQAVSGLRKTGYSWAEIAARLGVSRQAAEQRWGHR